MDKSTLVHQSDKGKVGAHPAWGYCAREMQSVLLWFSLLPCLSDGSDRRLSHNFCLLPGGFWTNQVTIGFGGPSLSWDKTLSQQDMVNFGVKGAVR